VPISLTGAEKLSLLVGMTANVKVQVGSVSNALLIPTLALQRASGQYQVLVANTSDPNGTPETVPVEVGLSDGTYTQITKGLNLGDQVVYAIASSSSSNAQQGMVIMGTGGVPQGAPPSR
jgi:multidrug efflux pump subunit AcrA (membrane-fusion protein)